MSSKGLDGLMLFNQRGERFAKHFWLEAVGACSSAARRTTDSCFAAISSFYTVYKNFYFYYFLF